MTPKSFRGSQKTVNSPYSVDKKNVVRKLTTPLAIPLDVLRTLATSPNPNISKSAIDLIAARCVKSGSLPILVKADLRSSDTELKGRAETAMRFLGDWKTDNEMNDPVNPSRRVSPSRLSIDSNSYEFDRLRADFQADAAAAGGWPVDLVNPDADEVLTMVSADVRGGSPNPNARHRNREAMVLQGSAELLDVGDVVRMRPI